MKSSPRILAVSILANVEHSGAFAENELDKALRSGKLGDVRDRRLLTEIVYGTLRMRGRLDWLIDSFYPPGAEALERDVRNILRTGLYQLFFLDRVPEYAVVNEAVTIAKRIRSASAMLVNAVLRTAARSRRNIVYPDFNRDPAGYISIFHSHPRWLVDRVIGILGIPETAAFCKANNETPPLTVRVNTLKISRREMESELRKTGLSSRPTMFSPDGLKIHGNTDALGGTACFQEGRIRIQDEGSQLISHIVDPKPGESVLDLCAGTGGKTNHLAQLMKNEGHILACDISGERIHALRGHAAAMGVTIVEALVADASEDDITDGDPFDRILVDAPCSGSGTLRRNPEIRWRLSPERVRTLVRLQEEMLLRSEKFLKPGGTLVYATCSIMPEENEEVVLAFLRKHPGYRIVPPPSSAVAGLLGPDGFFRSFPHRHGTDGFFAARLVKKAETATMPRQRFCRGGNDSWKSFFLH